MFETTRVVLLFVLSVGLVGCGGSPSDHGIVCGDGICHGSESATCCTDCGCPTGQACQSGACVAQVTMSWTLTDQCADGEATQFKFYDAKANLVWPTSTTHYVLDSAGSSTSQLLCGEGDSICFGASQPTHGLYWGVDLDDSQTCDGCCAPCAASAVSKTITCTN